MRILFLDDNIDHARVLYSQALEYVATSWDLLHCASIEEAREWLGREQFDLLLVAIYQRESKLKEFENFLARYKSLPIVVLSDSNDDAVHCGFVRRGAQDSLLTQTANGHYVMRRSRLAMHRHRRPARCRPKAREVAALQAACAEVSGNAATKQAKSQSHSWRVPVVSHRTLVIDDTPQQEIFDLSNSDVSRYETRESLHSATDLLTDRAWDFDAVLTHQAVLERSEPKQLQDLTRALNGAPMIAVAADRDDDAAVSLIDCGLDDCLLTDPGNQFAIERALRLANARFLSREADRERLESSSTLSVTQTFGRSDARRTSRYLCDHPVLAIPVLPTGAPDVKLIRDARALDISVGGLGLQLPSHQAVPSRNWVVGVTGQHGADDLELHFASVVVRNVSYPDEGLRIGTAFHSPDEDLLRPENLEPQFDSATCRYSTGLPESVLDQWCEVGVLRRVLAQRVLSCPECSSVLSLGAGCRACGSARFEIPVTEPNDIRSSDDGLRAGSDFNQAYHCLDCGQFAQTLAEVGQCMKCQLRLPLNMAVEELIFGYRVNHLDVMAIATSQHSRKSSIGRS